MELHLKLESGFGSMLMCVEVPKSDTKSMQCDLSTFTTVTSLIDLKKEKMCIHGFWLLLLTCFQGNIIWMEIGTVISAKDEVIKINTD